MIVTIAVSDGDIEMNVSVEHLEDPVHVQAMSGETIAEHRTYRKSDLVRTATSGMLAMLEEAR